MSVYKPLLLLFSSIIALAATQEQLEKDVEIISGSDFSRTNPTEAKFVGQQAFPNDVYGPHVRYTKNIEA